MAFWHPDALSKIALSLFVCIISPTPSLALRDSRTTRELPLFRTRLPFPEDSNTRNEGFNVFAATSVASAFDGPVSQASPEPSAAETGESDVAANPPASPDIGDEQAGASTETAAEPSPLPTEESTPAEVSISENQVAASSVSSFSLQLLLEAAGETVEQFSITCTDRLEVSCAEQTRIFELPEHDGTFALHWNLISAEQGQEPASECTAVVHSGAEPYSPTTIENKEGVNGSWRAADDTRWANVDFTCLEGATGRSRNFTVEIARAPRMPVLFQDPPQPPVQPDADCLEQARGRFAPESPDYDSVRALRDLLDQSYHIRQRGYRFLYFSNQCVLERVRPRTERDAVLATLIADLENLPRGNQPEGPARLRLLGQHLTEWLASMRSRAAQEMARVLGEEILADPAFAQRLRIAQSLQNVGAEFLSTNCRGAEALLRSTLFPYDDFALRDLEVFKCHESNQDRALAPQFNGSFEWIVAYVTILNNSGSTEAAPFREAIILRRDVKPTRFEFLLGKGDDLSEFILEPRVEGQENLPRLQDLPLQLNLRNRRIFSPWTLRNYEDYVLEVEPGSVADQVYQLLISNSGVYSPSTRPTLTDESVPLPFFIPGRADEREDMYQTFPLNIPFRGSGMPIGSNIETPTTLELYVRETIRERLRARNQVGLQVEQTAIAEATPPGPDAPLAEAAEGNSVSPLQPTP